MSTGSPRSAPKHSGSSTDSRRPFLREPPLELSKRGVCSAGQSGCPTRCRTSYLWAIPSVRAIAAPRRITCRSSQMFRGGGFCKFQRVSRRRLSDRRQGVRAPVGQHARRRGDRPDRGRQGQGREPTSGEVLYDEIDGQSTRTSGPGLRIAERDGSAGQRWWFDASSEDTYMEGEGPCGQRRRGLGPRKLRPGSRISRGVPRRRRLELRTPVADRERAPVQEGSPGVGTDL